MTNVAPAPRVGVVVPVFNESTCLRPCVEALCKALDALPQFGPWRMMIVDDASTDNTLDIAMHLAKLDPRIAVIRHARNYGAEAAFVGGARRLGTDIVVGFDADLSYDPAILEALIAPIATGLSDLVLASAYAAGGAVKNVPRLRAFMSRWANRYLSYASAERAFTFTCIVRAYRRDALLAVVHALRVSSCAVILLGFLRSNLRVAEVPATLAWPARRHSRMRAAQTLRRSWEILCLGVANRPSLLLAIPGLVPGLLPLVAFVAVIAGASAREIAVLCACTLGIQIASIAALGQHATGMYVLHKRGGTQ